MKPASFSEKPLPPIVCVARAAAVKQKEMQTKRACVHDSEVDTRWKTKKLLKWGEQAQNKTCFCTATTGLTCKLQVFFLWVSVKRALSIHITEPCFLSFFTALTRAIQRPISPIVRMHLASRVTKCKRYFLKRLFVLLLKMTLCQLYLFYNQWIIAWEHHATIKQGLLWVIYKSTLY